MRRSGGSRWDGMLTRGRALADGGLPRRRDGQPLAPLGPAALQHKAAVLRAHPDKKAVRALAAAPIRLERALHGC